jgi:predicted ATPase
MNRFNIVLKRFVSIFAKKEHPVALFLDDLHWVDIACLQFIGKIVISHIIKYLLIIGSYRDS